MGPTYLETHALASSHRVQAAVIWQQSQEGLATRSVKKDTPAARMESGYVASVTPRPFLVGVNSLSREKTCLDNAANAVTPVPNPCV